MRLVMSDQCGRWGITARNFPIWVMRVFFVFFYGVLPVSASEVDASNVVTSVASAGMTLVAEQQGALASGVSASVIVLAQAAVEPAVQIAARQPELSIASKKTEPVASRATAGADTADTVDIDAVVPPFSAASAQDSAEKKGSIRLFNTLEFRGALKNMPKWQRVVDAEEKSRTFNNDVSSFMRPSVYKQWVQLVERVKNANTMEKAKAVTAFFNRWPYRTDQDVYKLPDYWATPAEFMSKSGDCEDYAITKMYALIKLGVPPESMRIVALKDRIRNLAHAILVVYINNDAYVLDNLTDMVLTHTRYQHYWPQYSVNEVYRWAHVMPKNKK